jgi:hypothetical protein
LETTLGEVPNTDEAIERASIEIKRQLKLRGVEVEIRRRK